MAEHPWKGRFKRALKAKKARVMATEMDAAERIAKIFQKGSEEMTHECPCGTTVHIGCDDKDCRLLIADQLSQFQAVNAKLAKTAVDLKSDLSRERETVAKLRAAVMAARGVFDLGEVKELRISSRHCRQLVELLDQAALYPKSGDISQKRIDGSSDSYTPSGINQAQTVISIPERVQDRMPKQDDCIAQADTPSDGVTLPASLVREIQDALEEIARPPYKDSDPDSLVAWANARASVCHEKLRQALKESS